MKGTGEPESPHITTTKALLIERLGDPDWDFQAFFRWYAEKFNMPMPKPKPGEAEKDFVSRFMADQAMGVEFPDEAQRAAVAHRTFKEAHKDGKDGGELFTAESILDSLGLRSMAGRWGIGTALQYVKTVDSLFSAGISNPTLAFDLAPSVWAKELDSAARRLTYCDESSGDTDFITKSIREGTDIARGAVLEYDCILSTKRKDRDGDIVEPGGMDVDQKMPLLWQHVQSQPIGKHISVVQQDENRVICKFAIADIPLGRDAATLVKFGALRKSHGFKPVPGEFEPLEIIKQADGKQIAKGWHIRKSTVMEGSLVSIPANADANVLAVYEKSFDGLCTAFSRNLLSTDAVKHWAKSLYDQRPVVVAVAADPVAWFRCRMLELSIPPAVADTLISDLSTKGVKMSQMSTPVVISGNPDQAAKPGQAIDGGALAHDTDRKRCPRCGKADLDSTNSCRHCGYIDHANTTKPDTQPASSADENAGGGTKPITGTVPAAKPAGGGKAADGDDLATKCGDGGGKQKKCRCGSAMGDDGKCPKCGGTEYAKTYDLTEFSAEDLGRALAAKAVSGDRAAVDALQQAHSLAAVVTAERDPLAELFAE